MAIDPEEVNTAARAVLSQVKQLRDLSAGMINPVAGETMPHTDTITALKAEAEGVKAAWESARDALNIALTP